MACATIPTTDTPAKAERRCPKCRADINEVGFTVLMQQSYRPQGGAFVFGSYSILPDSAKCMLCDAPLPWVVGDLTRRDGR
ncbi:MAG: hypothetical protein KGL39_11390 [Patescibacteria group bacterium]|nr:hypothetical protein [Patescibacteria group bacterium]